jgi:TolB-like protein
MTAGLLTAYCVSVLAILPTLNSDRDEAAKPARGDGASIRDVRVTPAALESAREALASRERIAVLPFAASKGDPGAELAALGCSAAMTADLHYVPAFLVLERSEVLLVRRDPKSSLDALGRKLAARYLITGSLTREGDNDRLEAEVIAIGPPDDEAKKLARASAVRPGGQIYELADTVLLDLLGQLKATPAPERVAEMTRVPTTNDSARTLCEDGFALMDRATGLNRRDDQGLTARALKDSEAALKADPRYLRALLLQASCLQRLGETKRLVDCLTQAENLRVPGNRVDALTQWEVEGDIAALVKRDFAAAVAHYRKILEIDPGHLHALWMLTALNAGEYESSRWPGLSLEKATESAARLIVAHPRSAAARLLGGQKP